jgi:hypothetical protein
VHVGVEEAVAENLREEDLDAGRDSAGRSMPAARSLSVC